MYKNPDEHSNAQYELMYGSKEKKDNFFKGLELIEKQHSEFFKSDINQNRKITYYVSVGRPFDNSEVKAIGFIDKKTLPNQIQEEVIKLWKSIFDKE